MSAAATGLKTRCLCRYDELISRHLSDYSDLYNRVSLNIPSDENSKLLFDYGRYLMISSSRPGTQPSNLRVFGVVMRLRRGIPTTP